MSSEWVAWKEAPEQSGRGEKVYDIRDKANGAFHHGWTKVPSTESGQAGCVEVHLSGQQWLSRVSLRLQTLTALST